MTIQITTHGDALRHTARRVIVAIILTVVLSALRKAQDANLPTVALMCDVDRFKAINDRFGHEFGDKVLV